MKKKIVVLNVILIVYILSLSVGYAIFSESLTVKGVATTVEYYEGTNLPVTAQVRDTTNNLYHTATGTDILEYSDESWQDDTYEVTYIKNSTGTSGSTASFTVSFDNAAVLDMTEGQVSTDANALAKSDNPIVLANNTSGVVSPLVLQSNTSGIQTMANTSIKASATISKTSAQPNDIVDVTVTIGLDSLTAGVNETVTATVSYMLQNKIRYFYFKVNLNDVCLTKGHDYNTVETAPSYSGRGYYTHTCSRCANSYAESSSAELFLVNNLDFVDTSVWSSAFNNTSGSTLNPSSGFEGNYSQGIATLTVSYTGNYGAAWTGPINLTDAKQVVFTYAMYDNLYKTQSSLLSTKTQKGINTSTFGIADSGDLVKSQTFVSGYYQTLTYTRSSSSDAIKKGTVTIDVSGLSGEYYIKIYTKHSYSGDELSTANTAYTGFESIKIVYN